MALELENQERLAVRSTRHICQLATAHDVSDERVLHRMAETAAEFGYRSTFAVPYDGTAAHPNVALVSTGPRSHNMSGRVAAGIRLLIWAARSDADVFQFHDPDLLPAAILLKLMGRRVIYDVHDDYERNILARLAHKPRLACIASKLWWFAEKTAARAFDGVVVADRHLAAKFGERSSVILGNYPRGNFTNRSRTEEEETFNLLYVGGVSRLRGLGVVLEALKLIDIPELRLHVVGSGRDHSLIEQLRADPRVILHGQVPWRQLYRYYERAHVGLALYQPIPSFVYYPGENAVKILEYMAAGVPIVTSDFPGLRKFVKDDGAGLVVDPHDPEAVRDAIVELYQNEGARLAMGERGSHLFATKYNWEMHQEKLIELYDRVTRVA